MLSLRDRGAAPKLRMENYKKNAGALQEYYDWLGLEYGEERAPVYPRAGSWEETASKVVSAVLHPFLVPVYAIAVLMLGNTLMAAAPVKLKWFFSVMIVLVALVIPVLSIALLRALRLISSFSIERRQDRTIPLAIVALSYGLCIFMVKDIMWGFMIRKFLIAAFCCTAAALVITPYWKISLHMIAAGGVTAMFAVLAIASAGSAFVPLTAAILLSGLLGSARLYLGKHTPGQVAAGYFLGLVISAAAMLFIQ